MVGAEQGRPDLGGQVDVRPLQLGEQADFVLSLEWLFDPPGSRPSNWNRAQAEERAAAAITSDSSDLFGVWSKQHQLVGVASVYLDIVSVRFGRRASIEDLAVHERWRSKGIGAQLLSTVKAWAVDRGADYIFLESGSARTDAHRFYLHQGAIHAASAFRWTLT